MQMLEGFHTSGILRTRWRPSEAADKQAHPPNGGCGSSLGSLLMGLPTWPACLVQGLLPGLHCSVAHSAHKNMPRLWPLPPAGVLCGISICLNPGELHGAMNVQIFPSCKLGAMEPAGRGMGSLHNPLALEAPQSPPSYSFPGASCGTSDSSFLCCWISCRVCMMHSRESSGFGR